jgi:hypothetical protein
MKIGATCAGTTCVLGLLVTGSLWTLGRLVRGQHVHWDYLSQGGHEHWGELSKGGVVQGRFKVISRSGGGDPYRTYGSCADLESA